MTVVVIILLPVVLIYQAWTYYVFRRRVSKQEFLPSSGLGAPSSGPGAPYGGPHAASPDAAAPPAGQGS
jgi:cytochrome bd ubiquinol oxidase subunit II